MSRLDVPPEDLQRYYIDAFMAVYIERLEGYATFTREQVQAMIEDSLDVAYQERDHLCPKVNRSPGWKPELIVDGRDWTIKLGDANIVTFQY